MCGHLFFYKEMELHYYPTIQMTKGGTGTADCLMDLHTCTR